MANLNANDTVNKINNVAKDMASTGKDAYQSAAGSLEGMSHSIGERAGEAVAKFGSRANDYYKNSTEYVRENPVKGIAIAAATGVVVGGLLTMAMRRRHQ